MEGKNQLLRSAPWPPYLHYGVFTSTHSLVLLAGALSFFIQQISYLSKGEGNCAVCKITTRFIKIIIHGSIIWNLFSSILKMCLWVKHVIHLCKHTHTRQYQLDMRSKIWILNVCLVNRKPMRNINQSKGDHICSQPSCKMCSHDNFPGHLPKSSSVPSGWVSSSSKWQYLGPCRLLQ